MPVLDLANLAPVERKERGHVYMMYDIIDIQSNLCTPTTSLGTHKVSLLLTGDVVPMYIYKHEKLNHKIVGGCYSELVFNFKV